MHSFVINFYHRKVHFEPHRVRLQLSYSLKDLVASDRHNTNVGSVANLKRIIELLALTIEYDFPAPVCP